MIDVDDVCKQADSVRIDIIAKCVDSIIVAAVFQVNLFVVHSQVMDLGCLKGRNLDKNHASVLGSSYFLF
ncbi:hypothetical protein Pint_30599 [Pistacia integerrima]|uniref:Uncharacterized protein n=1 Tax=Pistacia integerrima TaxID=434235 RepID=A0ACC0X259_9ROSI|nr:hypothetical protein Pint_30599 [Pistacia integerrima]